MNMRGFQKVVNCSYSILGYLEAKEFLEDFHRDNRLEYSDLKMKSKTILVDLSFLGFVSFINDLIRISCYVCPYFVFMPKFFRRSVFSRLGD